MVTSGYQGDYVKHGAVRDMILAAPAHETDADTARRIRQVLGSNTSASTVKSVRSRHKGKSPFHKSELFLLFHSQIANVCTWDQLPSQLHCLADELQINDRAQLAGREVTRLNIRVQPCHIKGV